MDFIINNIDGILIAISSIIAAASALCALVPNSSANRFMTKFRTLLDILALNIGKAKQNEAA